jgi:hypothetical protein
LIEGIETLLILFRCIFLITCSVVDTESALLLFFDDTTKRGSPVIIAAIPVVKAPFSGLRSLSVFLLLHLAVTGKDLMLAFFKSILAGNNTVLIPLSGCRRAFIGNCFAGNRWMVSVSMEDAVTLFANMATSRMKIDFFMHRSLIVVDD